MINHTVGTGIEYHGGLFPRWRGKPPFMFYHRSLKLLFVLIIVFGTEAGWASPPPPFRSKPDSTAPPSWLRGVLNSLIEGPLHADIRGIDPGQLLPLSRVEYPKIILDTQLPHPRLMDFSRVEGFRYRYPWRGFYHLAIEEADRWAQGGIVNPEIAEKDRAVAAKALAVAYRIKGNQVYLETVETAFRSMPPLPKVVSFQGGHAGVGWGDDLEMGQALLHYAAAYDLTVNDLEPIVRDRAASMFAEVCDRLVDRMPLIPPDNHAFVISAGVGSMALVLSGIDGIGKWTPQDWMDAAMALQSYAIAAQVLPDGTYREGPYYARFSVSALLPFYLYIERLYHRNLVQHPRINALFDWMVYTSNPDGSTPQTDDGWSEEYLWEPLLISIARNPEVIRWSYQRRDEQFTRYQPNMVDALAFATFWPEACPPDGPPSRVFLDGGSAVFRDGWDENAFQAMLLGESSRTFGGRHEQVDPGNLLIQKGNKPLLVDAGYGPGGTSDPDHEGYVDAGSHNMVLMNGRGPEKNPLFNGNPGGSMGGAFDCPVMGNCRVDMRYGNQPVIRRLATPDHSYLLLEDLAPGNSDSRMTSVFHAPGDVYPNAYGGYSWTNQDASLTLIPLSTPAAPNHTMLSRSYHSHRPGHSELHHRIEMHWGDPRQAVFLLLPRNDYTVMPLGVAGNTKTAGWIVEGEGNGDYGSNYFTGWMSHHHFRDMVVIGDGSEVRGAGVATNAFRIWWREGMSGEITTLSFRQASFVNALGFSIESSRRITGTLWNNGLHWWGYFECNTDSVEVCLQGFGGPGLVRYRGHVMPYECQNGDLNVVLAGEGTLEFGIGPPGIWIPHTRLGQGSFLEEAAWSPDPEMRIRMISPYDQARMEGEILSNIQGGVISALDPWMQERWGVEGGGDALVGYVLGMADAMTSSQRAIAIRVPHRTRIQRQIGDVGIALDGEGFWGDENLRRFGGTVGIRDRGRFTYQEERPFQAITRRSIDIETDNGHQGIMLHEDGPGGDLWSNALSGVWQGTSYQTGVQWGTGDLEDWRFGELGIQRNRWAANIAGGQTTDQQSLLADLNHMMDRTVLGYRYQYLSRGEYRGVVRASRAWGRLTTGTAYEWTGGDIPSIHIIRNQTRWWENPWSWYSDVTMQVPDSLDVIAMTGYRRNAVRVSTGIRGNSDSPTVIPDRMVRVGIDPTGWSSLEIEGCVTDETERHLQTGCSCNVLHSLSLHGRSNWDIAYGGPVRITTGWWWKDIVMVGGDVWRQWYPIREDGIWLSMSTEGLPPVNPAGFMGVRWDEGGEVREVQVKVESRCADVGPGFLYLEEPGVDRRFEGYFRMEF